jgi:hypothetical protein
MTYALPFRVNVSLFPYPMVAEEALGVTEYQLASHLSPSNGSRRISLVLI